MGHPSVYPTGTTIYDPERAWSGYLVFQAAETGAVLVDMNGRELRLWPNLHGFSNKILPGGVIMGHSGGRDPRYGMQDMVDLIQIDWDGHIRWQFDRYEEINDPGNEVRWMARAHHDYQRAGNPVGYYAPGLEPQVEGGNTLILAHKNLYNPAISDKQLLDDTIIEVDWHGNILWEWRCSDHVERWGLTRQRVRRSMPIPICAPVAVAWATGCISTPCRHWGRTNGMTRVIRAFIPITLSGTRVKQTLSPLLINPAARLSGNWGQITAHRH